MACLAFCVDSYLSPLRPGSTSPRITSCDKPPVIFSGESCIPLGDVSLPPLLPACADLECITGTVVARMSPRIGATPALLPRLGVGLRIWFAEGWAIHPHQVPHDQCCNSGWMLGCWGGCFPESSWVGDDWCDAELQCYCEEKASPPCSGCRPCPFAPQAGHQYTAAGEPLQAHLVIHGVAGVLCGP